MHRLQSAAKCPMILQLKQGPLGQWGGIDVWATWICSSLLYCWSYSAIFAWKRQQGKWVHDMSIGTGWLFMLFGVLDELYCEVGFAGLC